MSNNLRPSKPTVHELDLELKGLTRWQRFATHLPMIEQSDIKLIEQDNQGSTEKQRLALFGMWLRKCTSASWLDVVSALEKIEEYALAEHIKYSSVSSLLPFPTRSDHHSHSPNRSDCYSHSTTRSYHDSHSPTIFYRYSHSPIRSYHHSHSPTCEPSVNYVETLLDHNIVQELKKLHGTFVNLATKIQLEMDHLVISDESLLRPIAIKIMKAYRSIKGLTDVKTTDEFFVIVDEHYSFLDCDLLVTIVESLQKKELLDEMQGHVKAIRAFKRNASVKSLQKNLGELLDKYGSSNLEVTVKLEDEWGERAINVVEQLLKILFPCDYHECKWYKIMPGSFCVSFLIPENILQSLVTSSNQKLQFMQLIGVFGLIIGNTPILGKHENKSFTFDSALLESSQCGNNEAVQFQLYMGVNVNYSNSEGKTALMLACAAGHEEVVQTLVSAGASVDLQDSLGQTALILANGKIGVARCLLLAKADPDLQQKDGNTALHIACCKGQNTIAELLLSFGATFVIANTKGDTAFLASVRGNNTKILELMLNSIPHSPFIVSLGVVYACRFGHSAVFNLFAKQLECTPQVIDLFMSCAEGDVGSVRQHIKEFNIDPNTTLISGITPLMIASSCGNIETLECLLQAEADVNSKDEEGYTPLAYATSSKSLTIIQRLRKSGANPNLPGDISIIEKVKEENRMEGFLDFSSSTQPSSYTHTPEESFINQLRVVKKLTSSSEDGSRFSSYLFNETTNTYKLFNKLQTYYSFKASDVQVVSSNIIHTTPKACTVQLYSPITCMYGYN